VISGALLLLIVLFFPGGLMGFIYSRFPRTQKVLE
jgi:ABC-type branched-subunit amino acid transport system permease subunit